MTHRCWLAHIAGIQVQPPSLSIKRRTKLPQVQLSAALNSIFQVTNDVIITFALNFIAYVFVFILLLRRFFLFGLFRISKDHKICLALIRGESSLKFCLMIHKLLFPIISSRLLAFENMFLEAQSCLAVIMINFIKIVTQLHCE